MKVQELREFLSPLNAEAIRRLAVQLDIPYARKDELAVSVKIVVASFDQS